MKSAYIILLLLFSNCFVYANTLQGDSVFSKWRIGLAGSIDYYIYDYNNYEGYGNDGDHYYESRNLHYSEGLLLTRKLSNKFDLISGIIYAEKGFNRVTNPMLLPPYYSGEWRYIELKYYSYYCEIPLLLQYRTNRNKGFSGIISGGFITSIPLRETVQYVSIDGEEARNKTINAWQWEREDMIKSNDLPFYGWLTLNKTWKIHESVVIGTGISCRLKRFEFNFQSRYQFYFINIYDIRLNKKAKSFSNMLNINYLF